MLQFITSKSDNYDIAQQARMAIDGGCLWIQVSNSLPEGTTQKQALQDIKQLCEDSEVFLIVDSDVNLAKEMQIHGVHLKPGDMEPGQAREELGAEAIIGVDVDTAADILSLKGRDMDYVVIDFNDKHDVEAIAKIVDEVRSDGFDINIVVRGDIDVPVMYQLKSVGVNGFAMSNKILEAADPVGATAGILNALGQ